MPGPLVSIVVPAYNPTTFLLDAIASASAQTHSEIEIILVNDGSVEAQSAAILDRASRLVTTYIDQPNRGLGAARNAGFEAARAEYVVPLDADDLLDPAYIAECLPPLVASDAAFSYSDFEVFGTAHYRERPGEYNLYRLLDRNYLTYAALIRKRDWGACGGYDQTRKCLGYEDWEFWLKLGECGRFGQYVSKPLFRYRKHGPSLYDAARARHQEFVAYIQSLHPNLYAYENRARIKARWSPAVSIVASHPVTNQTIEDIQTVAPGEIGSAPVVLDATAGPLHPQAAELAALANWSGRAEPLPGAAGRTARGTLHRHLLNAGLLGLDAWTRHPLRSLARLIPLRAKERVNRAAGRPVFDLAFYLQFQPNSVLVGDTVVEPLVYYPQPANGRKRVAFVTTQLGPGGAEQVLYDMTAAFDSDRFETLLIATQSHDHRWAAKWRQRVHHVYDLARVIPPQRMTAGLVSLIANWRCDYLVLQNSLYGYAALPHIRKALPGIEIVDVNHYLDEGWDQIAATAAVESSIHRRVALAVSVRDRLLVAGTPESKILLLRNGVDLDRFRPAPRDRNASKTILFAARLTERKQPLLVADIARELATLRPQRDFRFVIAGDGPEDGRVRERVHKLGLDGVFDFRGQVDDLAPLLAACDLLLIPSRSEGVPLVLLEALASARPVVASRVGAIPEVLDSSCGVLIERIESPGEFAKAIHRLLDDSELRERMGAAGRSKVEASHDIRQTRATFAGLFGQSSSDQGSSVSVSATNRSTAIE